MLCVSHSSEKVPRAALATKLEQQQPPGGQDTLKLGFGISPFPGGMSRIVDSPCAGVGKTLCLLSLWGCWMDQHGLGMLSVTPSDTVGPDPFPVCQAGTLQPWKSFSVPSIRAGPGSTSAIPAEEPQRGHFWEQDVVTPRRGPQ